MNDKLIEVLTRIAEALEAGTAATTAVPAPLPMVAIEIIGNLEWRLVPAEKKMTWEEAKAYAASLGDGWRLPTVQELVSLWDYDKGCCEAFPDAKGWFWSSSPDDSTNAWHVNFGDGSVDRDGRNNTRGVRCVRDVRA